MAMKNKTAPKRVRSGLVAALDVGTTKVCCLIARLDPNGGPAPEDRLKIIGIGHQVSHGLRSGAIIDLDETEASIRATVETAEQMAGENIPGDPRIDAIRDSLRPGDRRDSQGT